MKNYVLIYNLSDEESAEELQKKIASTFPRNKSIVENTIQYFSFAERELPKVHDALQEIMDRLTLTDADYIALYYTREEEPDEINRLMVFGTSSTIENDLTKTTQTLHQRVLGDLLEFDFIRSK